MSNVSQRPSKSRRATASSSASPAKPNSHGRQPAAGAHKPRAPKSTKPPATASTPSTYESRLDDLRREHTEKFNRHIAWMRERAERVSHPTRRDGESHQEWVVRMAKKGELAQQRAEHLRVANAAALERLAAKHARAGRAQKLIADAREIADKASTNVFARLTRPQTRKLERILGELRKFPQDEMQGQNERTMRRIYDAYRIIDEAITTADWMMTTSESPTKTRQLWVRNVAYLWNEQTGQPCTASRNMQQGGRTLNNTALVQFIHATLDEALPGLTNGEILRGVQIARNLVEAKTPRWF